MHLYLSAFLAVTLAATAFAQQTKSNGNWANVNQIGTGAEIRVTLANGKTLSGIMQRVTPDSLAINATNSQETLSRQDIRRVTLKRPGHRGRNALIGLAIGAGTGLGLGAGLDANAPSCRSFKALDRVVFAPMGALVGTVVGVMLAGGSRDVYRAE